MIELLKAMPIDEQRVLLKLLEIREKRLLFATKYHHNTHGQLMDFTNNPQLVQIYNTLARKLVIQGSVQSLKSEYIIVDHLAAAACGLAIFFVLPKFETRNTYVMNRVNKRISESAEYRRLLKGGDFDNTAIKSFGPGVIKYVGSNVRSDMLEYAADLLIVDEEDACDEANLRYATDRLAHSQYQIYRHIGNPTKHGIGINARYTDSTQNRWAVFCDKCKEPIILDWFETVIDTKRDSEGHVVDYWLRDKDWKEGCGRDVFCMCPRCAVPINRRGAGTWITGNPSAMTEGYLMTMLPGQYNAVHDILKEWKIAWDSNEMDHFYNSYLGLPYAAESARLTLDMLRKATLLGGQPYRFMLQPEFGCVEGDSCAGPCTMGVDVGKKFDVRISQQFPVGVRKAVYIGKVVAREELIALGIRYHVKIAVIDSGPEYRVSEDFMSEAPFTVWLCRYDSEGADRRIRRDAKARMILADRTLAMDKALSQLKFGKNLIPENFVGILNGQYVKEMTEPFRQEELDRHGNTKYVWSKCIDHQRHADVYDMLAAQMLPSKDGIRVHIG